ncbi:FG-GAP-like repeat-containing protein [Streptomyces sp. NBC_01077]|uniref:FG-GAP-like repeat-containing protein n=1 Tax=Streptomyces sp. NBC_01077 TaxID=2903746 RepID=UPI00386948D5|nr:FG-GAP-like repeat-containing protein [Streptomyces sp. NBC_01077]
MISPLDRRPRRHALGRIALAVSLAVTAGVGTTVGAAAETPGTTGEAVVVSPGARFVPRATIVLNAGETGFLTAQEGDDRLRWIDYATGRTTVLDHRLPKPLSYDVDEFRFTEYPADFGHGSDTVAVHSESPAPHVTLQQRAGGGATTTVAIPEGQTYVGTYGDTVITRTGTESAVTSLHLLHPEAGGVREQKLEGLPEGWNLSISEGDARSIAVRGIKWVDSTMSQGWWVVDLASGKIKTLSTHGESVSFDKDTVFHLGAPSGSDAQVYRRDDLDAAPTTLDLRDVASYDDVVRRLGDALVTVSPPNPGNNEYRGNRLAQYVPDGIDTSLLDVASTSLSRTPDGSLLVAGAEQRTDYGALDWGYYRFTAAADGTVTRKRLADIEDMEAKPAGISLGSGILTTADDSKLYQPGGIIGGYRSTWLKTSGRPEELRSATDGFVTGRDDDCSPTWRVYCVSMFASGDGHHGRKAGTEQDMTVLHRNGSATWGPRLTTGLSSPQLVDLSGRFGVVNQASGGSQAIVEFRGTDSGAVLQKREPVASALWGNTLWSATKGSNTVTSKALPAGTAGESFTTTNRCEPTDLQAVGRWVYWKCQDESWDVRGGGLYDRSTKRFMSLGSDDTLLGDGYLVSRSDSTGLTLVDLHNGIPGSGKVADLPQRVVATPAQLGANTTRRAGWTVDRFGGHVAFTGDDRRVRVVPSGVPASRIAIIDTDAAASVNVKSGAWKPRWWLSKPAASWSLALRHKATGKVVRTLTGGEARGLVASAWDGKDATGRTVANGAYAWTLTAKAADGQAADLSVSGAVSVTGGAAVWRDMGGDDGVGDLLVMDTAGLVSMYRGTGTGALTAKIAGTGTKFATSSTFVPFGDVNADGCADVLARVGDQLRAYRPGCGKVVSASSPYASIGSGWGQYDVLTSPGDANGDGYIDLIARQASTGDLYFYAGTADHRVKSRVRIGTNWKLYKKIVGAGDLNGDGRGDLLGVDAAGVLWRYYGTVTGGVTARVKIGPGWNAYSALAAVGDLSGDGRADLVARDTAGKLWRYSSNGAGLYGARVLIGSGGWNGFKGLY